MSDDEIAKELLANAENKSSGKMNYFSRLGRRFIHTIGIHEYKTLKKKNGRRVKKCQYCSNIKLFGKYEEWILGSILTGLCLFYILSLLAAFYPLNLICVTMFVLSLYGYIKMEWESSRSWYLDGM